MIMNIIMLKNLPGRTFPLVSDIGLGTLSACLQYKLLMRNFSFEILFEIEFQSFGKWSASVESAFSSRH